MNYKYLNPKKIKFIPIFSLFLNGCASIVSGQNQVVSVDTYNQKGAVCELSNNKGKWFIPSTPGTTTVNRSYDDLIVMCKKDDMIGETKIKSSTKGMAFGNILAGGIIGAAIDCSNGSAYDYPSLINVSLEEKAS